MSTGNLSQIYNILFEGEKITVEVPIDELNAFRTAIFRYKSAQETMLIGLEMMASEEVKSLTFKVANLPVVYPDGTTVVAVDLSFTTKSPAKTYSFVIRKKD